MKPLISVIIPVFGVEKYLDKCIESVLKQTYENLEIILVDDGSPDRCGIMCDEYEKKDIRIKVIHKENGGLSSARNRGIDECNGEYISFIDSDDFVSPVFIETLYHAANKYDADVVTNIEAVSFMDGKDDSVQLVSTMEACSFGKCDSRDVLLKLLYQRIPNGAQHRLYKHSIFEDLRFPIGYLFEDVATIYKAFIKASRIAYVKGGTYAYRIRSNSIVRMKFSEKKMVAIPIGDELYFNIACYNKDLQKAAASRALALNYQVFLQVPVTDRKAQEQLWKEIKKYRKEVLLDAHRYVRLKNRIAAMVSYLGMKISHRLGRKLIYGN